LVDFHFKALNRLMSCASQEDNKLKAFVAEWCERGDRIVQWSAIANKMPGRSGKQCRERWSYCLRPDIKKGDWSHAEDQLLDRLQIQLGNKWTLIAASLPGRTDNDVKNRWHARKKSAARYHLASSTRMPGRDQSRCHTEYKAPATTKAAFMPVSSQQICGRVIDTAIVRICNADSNLPLHKPPTYQHANAIHAYDAAFVRRCSADSNVPLQKPPTYQNVNAIQANDAAFVRCCSADSNLPLQKPLTHHRVDAIYANDIFSPSYFPRQLRMSTAITDPATATPFTPLMVLAEVSSCHSGPFISDIELFYERTLECINGGSKKSEASQDGGGVPVAGMTPLPYKKNHQPNVGPSSPRVLDAV
jgi:hypothetical protein